ncbi:hypothetical protein CDAR_433221 [Caerostris darwini]|uniref:Uncharacterized protein n=1 Tax=Caerostris darwini TaxID=1538125 RepID=A0AAV4QIG9_9ARAC|nr:hypothetical protein CDAR_433221 [Caerostris darwini]
MKTLPQVCPSLPIATSVRGAINKTADKTVNFTTESLKDRDQYLKPARKNKNVRLCVNRTFKLITGQWFCRTRLIPCPDDLDPDGFICFSWQTDSGVRVFFEPFEGVFEQFYVLVYMCCEEVILVQGDKNL